MLLVLVIDPVTASHHSRCHYGRSTWKRGYVKYLEMGD